MCAPNPPRPPDPSSRMLASGTGRLRRTGEPHDGTGWVKTLATQGTGSSGAVASDSDLQAARPRASPITVARAIDMVANVPDGSPDRQMRKKAAGPNSPEPAAVLRRA